jgi:hypothetical protein
MASQKTAGIGSNLLTIGGLMARDMPLLGAGISAVSAGNRLFNGDILGAGLDVGSAIANPFAGPGTLISTGLSGINMLRDMSGSDEPKKRKHEFMKAAAQTQFARDMSDPSAGTDSDLYKTIAPLISSESDEDLSGYDAARTNDLKSQVRKGLVGLEYVTGLKKNTGNTFYDEHPVQAVLSDTLKKSVPIGAAAGAGALGINYLRQMANMRKTEPAKMSRTDNPVDATNPANLLKAKGSDVRPDIARVFGDLEANPELRLSLIDKLNKADESNSFLKGHRDLEAQKAALTANHETKRQELQKMLESSGDTKDVNRIKALLNTHNEAHAQELAKIEGARKALHTSAHQSQGARALENYANLSESLRRAKEQGGLKGRIGEGLKHLGGVSDLIEKGNITGASPHFNEELLHNVIRENLGSHLVDPEWQKFREGALREIADPAHQASGLRKAFSRAKIPLAIGAGTALGGTALYHLIKAIQDQSYSQQKMNDWKKTLLQSRGDFEGAKQYEQPE